MYSQNDEARIVQRYFNGRIGNLLDIGANDGVTFSNSYDLMQLGWFGCFMEPSPVAFAKLEKLHAGNKNAWCYNYGIAAKTGVYEFHESGAHVPNGQDVALVSSIDPSETKRWKDNGVKFKTMKVNMKSWADFIAPSDKFHFISIDAEGCDWDILQQIDLKAVSCECICIEWNSKPELLQLYADYCKGYGMKRVGLNAENVIFAI